MKKSFSISKPQCVLRASSLAYKYGDALHEFDQLMRSTLSQITNLRMNEKIEVKCHSLFVLTDLDLDVFIKWSKTKKLAGQIRGENIETGDNFFFHNSSLPPLKVNLKRRPSHQE